MSDRFLGCGGCAIAVLRNVGKCDRLLGMLGSAISVWICGDERSLFWGVGVRKRCAAASSLLFVGVAKCSAAIALVIK